MDINQPERLSVDLAGENAPRPQSKEETVFSSIQKRDGRVVSFDIEKISAAIFKAAQSVGGQDLETARQLAAQVVDYLKVEEKISLPSVEEVQDAVEKVLIENGHARTAKAYILYRDPPHPHPRGQDGVDGRGSGNSGRNEPRKRQRGQFAVGQDAADCFGSQPHLLPFSPYPR